MNMYEGHAMALKTIISDVLGDNASRALVGKMYALLDDDYKDFASLKDACVKIEKLVVLFHGPDKAKIMNARFKDSFLKAGFPER